MVIVSKTLLTNTAPGIQFYVDFFQTKPRLKFSECWLHFLRFKFNFDIYAGINIRSHQRRAQLPRPYLHSPQTSDANHRLPPLLLTDQVKIGSFHILLMWFNVASMTHGTQETFGLCLLIYSIKTKTKTAIVKKQGKVWGRVRNTFYAFSVVCPEASAIIQSGDLLFF